MPEYVVEIDIDEDNDSEVNIVSLPRDKWGDFLLRYSSSINGCFHYTEIPIPPFLTNNYLQSIGKRDDRKKERVLLSVFEINERRLEILEKLVSEINSIKELKKEKDS